MRKKREYKKEAGTCTKYISFLITVLLIVTTIPSVVLGGGLSSDAQEDVIVSTKIFTFSQPEIIPEDDFVKIQVDNLAMRLRTGEPQLPTMSYRFELPYGSTDVKVTIDHSPIQKMMIQGTVLPGPVPELLDYQKRPLVKALTTLATTLHSTISGISKPVIETDDFNEYIYESEEPYGEFYSSDVFIGRNIQGELATFVLIRCMPCILSNPSKGEASFLTDISVKIEAQPPTDPLQFRDEYDLLILSANDYVTLLDDLVDHKEEVGLRTLLVGLDEIYDEDYFDLPEDLRDSQEKIKYFIFKAVTEWNVRYVMAVGGWRTFVGLNKPDQQFPVRISHTYEAEPMIVSDQYYSCCIKDEGGPTFDTWDTNLNDRFAEWDWQGWDYYDPYPDVYFGRLACRNKKEVQTMVDKIITYETETFGEEWFNTMFSITGDGFQDIGNTYTTWNINSIDDGEYTIYAQSQLDDDPNFKGPIDSVTITINRDDVTTLSFNEDDHLSGKIKPLDDSESVFPECYPGYPVAEICSPDEGDVIGNTNVGPWVPPQAYEGQRWAVVNYNADTGDLQLIVKSYDPVPHDMHNPSYKSGSTTDYKVWIEDDQGTTIADFGLKRENWYWEGEMEAQLAINYANGGSFSDETVDGPFEVKKIWTSNGNFTYMEDVLDTFTEGAGLAYVNGHSSCMVWGDHYPGIPGGRANGQVNGLATIYLAAGLNRYQNKGNDPYFPLSKINNKEKLPVLLFSGCHSGQFDTSLISLLHDPYNVLLGDRYATWTPEGLAWWLTRLEDGGAIATIGNTGLGSGYVGDGILTGLTGWFFPRFFFNYNGDQDENGHVSPKLDILGEVHVQTLVDYHEKDDVVNDKIVRKHFEGWALLGDPSLKIGGYDMDSLDRSDDTEVERDYQKSESQNMVELIKLEEPQPILREGEYVVTKNPAEDTNPQALISDGSGNMLVGYQYETPLSGEIHPGFAYTSGGAAWKELIWANSYDSGACSLYRWEDESGEHCVGSASLGAGPWGCFRMGDMTDPTTWIEDSPWAFNNPLYPGRWGVAVTGHEGEVGGVWTFTQGVFADWVGPGFVSQVADGSGSQYDDFAGDCDHSTGWHYWVFEKTAANTVYLVRAEQTEPLMDNFQSQTFTSSSNPDIAAEDDWVYLVTENSGTIKCRSSDSNGQFWDTTTVTNDGTYPKVLLTDDGDIEVYYIRNNNVYKSTSTNQGQTWTEEGQISDAEVSGSSSPYQIASEGMVYDKGDGDLYADIFIDTIGVLIEKIELSEDGTTIVVYIINSGTVEADFDWDISIVGDSPLGDFLGGGLPPILKTIVTALLKGRVLLARRTTDSDTISSSNQLQLQSKKPFGLGHVLVTVRISHNGDMLIEKSEDAFLVGGTILLRYPEE